MWNPYELLAPTTRRALGVGAVVAVLALWAGIAASGAVPRGQLPAPWDVAKAFVSLAAWSDSNEPTQAERPLAETALAGTMQKGDALDTARCAEVCPDLLGLTGEIRDLDCEVDWSEPGQPDGILWCKGTGGGQSKLLTATVWSAGRVAVAGLIVVLVGLPIGILMGSSPRINALFSPLVDPFRSAPIVAINPLLVMWLGIGETMKIVFLVLGAIVYLIPMVRDAVQAVPQTYWISARDLGATPFEAVRHSVLPMAMPRVADAIIVSVSIMWTYITVAEYVNAEKGLGQLIQNARKFSAMDQVLVGIIVIIALALVTYQGMTWLKERLFPWEVES